MLGRTAQLTAAIATLDRPAALSRCLEALLAGAVVPAEILVVDQGEDERAWLAVEAHSHGNRSIRHLRQRRRGLAASRNIAISQANCEAIAFTDDDCVPDPQWIAAIDDAFKHYPIDAVTGRVLPLGPDAPGMYAISSRVAKAPIEFHGRALPWLVGSGGNFACSLRWLQIVGGFDERLGAGSPGKAAEDMDLFYRLLSAGALMRYEPGAVVYHERQNRARRLASRWGYGYGMGAFCGIRLRGRDSYAAHVLAQRLRGLCWELTGYSLKCEWFQAHQQCLTIAGTLAGLVYGLTVCQPYDGTGDGRDCG